METTKLKGDIAEQAVILYIEDLEVFYVMPNEVFISYGSEIHLVETDKRQRKPISAIYKEAWSMILQRAALVEMPK